MVFYIPLLWPVGNWDCIGWPLVICWAPARFSTFWWLNGKLATNQRALSLEFQSQGRASWALAGGGSQWTGRLDVWPVVVDEQHCCWAFATGVGGGGTRKVGHSWCLLPMGHLYVHYNLTIVLNKRRLVYCSGCQDVQQGRSGVGPGRGQIASRNGGWHRWCPQGLHLRKTWL